MWSSGRVLFTVRECISMRRLYQYALCTEQYRMMAAWSE